MPKQAGTKLYYYYGVIFNNKNHYKIYKKALELLEEKRLNILGTEIPGNMIPHNIISIDNEKGIVSLSWYAHFWLDPRPLLVYTITINTNKNTITIRRMKNFVHGDYPYNYLHRKELFIDGLEEIALNPYMNDMTLAWNTKTQQDVWRPLPWAPVIIRTHNKDLIIKSITDIINEYRDKKKRLKILIDYKPR